MDGTLFWCKSMDGVLARARAHLVFPLVSHAWNRVSGPKGANLASHESQTSLKQDALHQMDMRQVATSQYQTNTRSVSWNE